MVEIEPKKEKKVKEKVKKQRIKKVKLENMPKAPVRIP